MPYQTVLITAATSTTNRVAEELMAMHIGAPVVATTRTSKKRDILLNAGANYVGLVQRWRWH